MAVAELVGRNRTGGVLLAANDTASCRHETPVISPFTDYSVYLSLLYIFPPLNLNGLTLESLGYLVAMAVAGKTKTSPFNHTGIRHPRN